MVASLVVVAAMLAAAPADAIEIFDELTGERSPVPTQTRHDVDQTTGVVVGAIRIPTIGIDHVMREGVAASVINQGPAHWAGTTLPGGQGNVVVAGHRTTYSHPFADLDRLARGNLIFVTDANGREVTYVVTSVFVVDPKAMWITNDSGEPVLILFACHPKGSAA